MTCLALTIFSSPLKDDGYDISDYLNVHPSYGTLEDFNAFMAAAHERNIQVLILRWSWLSTTRPINILGFKLREQLQKGASNVTCLCVVAHAREVQGARIIFTDTEKSNWTWDPAAQAYYWHRSFSHQPDLNFDNPRETNVISRFILR